ncbi:MAG: tetratricopeptide repeat protein [Endomicrobia bacterium]|nr:tetratricopeptide repeat protein [Bacillota bacterium]MCL1972221.1 tetratricopeptide repeat protein [Endomicrobiia bacterium]
MKVINFIKNHTTILPFCFFLILIVFVYGQSLKYDYTYLDDDTLVLRNYDFISNYKNIPRFFSKSVFYSSGDSFYRPILTLSFFVDAMIAGKKPFMYHLSGIVFHIISVFLIFVFFRKMQFDETLTFLFVSLFAVHPALLSAVAWIPGRNDTILTIFVLLSVIFLFDYFENNKKIISKFIIFAFMFFVALFTKESAIAMLVVIPVFMFFFCKNTSKKDYFTVFLTMFFIAFMYTVARTIALGGASSNMAFDFFKSAKSIFVYLEYIIIPSRIYLVTEKLTVDFLTVISCVIFFVPVVASLFFNIGRKKIVLFGLLWFVAFLAPSFMSPNDNFLLLTHRLYSASLGVMFIFIEFFTAVSVKIKLSKKYLYFMLIIFIVLFTFTSFMQVKKFQNRETYFFNALNEQPDSEILRAKVAGFYAEKGMLEEAKKEILSIKSEDGSHSAVYYGMLAYIYSLEGSYDKAIEIFERLIAVNPHDEIAIYSAGGIYFLQGEYGKALEYAERLLNIRPEQLIYQERYNKFKAAYDENLGK